MQKTKIKLFCLTLFKCQTNFIFFLLIFALTTLSSCNYIFERFFISHPKNEEFKYYSKEKLPQISEKLDTENFYYNTGLALGEGTVYTYLAFKNDGTVVVFGHTAMLPDTVLAYPEILYPKRKRNKRPKNFRDDFGFYQTVGDSIFVNYYVVGVLGADDWIDLKGVIKEDKIIFSGREYSATGGYGENKLENWVFKRYEK